MGFMEMVSSVLICFRQESQFLCREKPLPDQFLCRPRIVHIQISGQKHTAETGPDIFFMQMGDMVKMLFQFFQNCFWKGNRSILFSPAVMNG